MFRSFTYKGFYCDNTAGPDARWNTLGPDGRLRADTKAGLKHLITETLAKQGR